MVDIQHEDITEDNLHPQFRFAQAGDPAASANNGDVWLDTDDNQLYLRVSDAWQVVKVAAGSIVSGTVATARLGSGTADGTTFLRGDSTWAAPSGGGVSGPLSSWVAGKYYGPEYAIPTSWTGSAVTANRLYGTPFLVPATYTMDRIAVGLSSGATGNVRLGIYAVSAGLPTSLVLDAGAVAVSGVTEVTISQSLSAGWYYLAAVFDGTPTMFFGSGVTWGPLGQTTPNTAAVHANVYIAHTYGALPDPFGAGVTYSNAPLKLCLRRS